MSASESKEFSNPTDESSLRSSKEFAHGDSNNRTPVNNWRTRKRVLLRSEHLRCTFSRSRTADKSNLGSATGSSTNPFEDVDSLDKETLSSPLFFKQFHESCSKTPESCRWSIGQLSAMYPIEIDEAGGQTVESLTSPEEEKAQKAIEKFWKENPLIVPSPNLAKNHLQYASCPTPKRARFGAVCNDLKLKNNKELEVLNEHPIKVSRHDVLHGTPIFSRRVPALEKILDSSACDSSSMEIDRSAHNFANGPSEEGRGGNNHPRNESIQMETDDCLETKLGYSSDFRFEPHDFSANDDNCAAGEIFLPVSPNLSPILKP